MKLKSGGGNRHAYVCDVSCVHEFALAFHLLAPASSLTHQYFVESLALPNMAVASICAVAGCNKQTVGGPYGEVTCGYNHYLLWTGQDDDVLFPKCDREGFYVLHHVCTYSIGWDGMRAVVTASLGFDSCAVCCAFVFPNAGCNSLKRPQWEGFCSWGCQDSARRGGAAAPAEEWLTCVVPHCNKKRGDPFYGAKYFVFITYLIYLVYSGGNRLCFF